MTFRSDGPGDSGNGHGGRASGHKIGGGIAIGAGLGVALGLALGNLALGIAIGCTIGVTIGVAMDEERGGLAATTYGTGRLPAWAVIAVGAALLLVGLAVFLLLAWT